MIRPLLALLLPILLGAAELIVFLPESSGALAVQRALQDDPALQGVQVLVAPRWRMFDDLVQAHPEAWVLASSHLLASPGWHPVLQGRRLGLSSFRYRLIAVDRPDGSGPPPGTGELGLVQEFARADAEGIVTRGFPGASLPPRLRLVSKSSDLVQVLGLDLVTGVVATPTLAAQAMARFPGRVRILAESQRLRLPVVAVRRPEQAAMVSVVSGLSTATLTMVGLDAFEPFTGPVSPWVVDAPP